MNDALKRTERILQDAALSIDLWLNPKAGVRQNGFVLLVFPFDHPAGARTNYVSNAERADMIVALKEILARFEGRVVDHGTKQ